MKTTRVLVALSPRMYREAIALSIRSGRPGLVDVRMVSPGAAEAEVGRFRPHLLVHGDGAPIDDAVLAGVPCRVEVLYTDGMDALVKDGHLERIQDASTEDLLAIVDRAAEGAGPG